MHAHGENSCSHWRLASPLKTHLTAKFPVGGERGSSATRTHAHTQAHRVSLGTRGGEIALIYYCHTAWPRPRGSAGAGAKKHVFPRQCHTITS